MKNLFQFFRLAIIVIGATGMFGCSSSPKWDTDHICIIKDVRYAESYRNTYDLYLPANKKPKALMLFIHGGSWISGEKDEMTRFAMQYVAEGYVTASINYSRLDTDSIVIADKVIRSSHKSMLEEIDTSIKAIQKKCKSLGCSLEQMAIGGYSAGGHLAMLYASSYTDKSSIPIKFQISWVGPSDFNMLFPTPDVNQPFGGQLADLINSIYPEWGKFAYHLSGKEYNTEEITTQTLIDLKSSVSPIDIAHPATPPAILAYGGKDGTVDPAHGIQMANKLKELGVDNQLIIFPDSGHELGRNPECSDSLHKTILNYCEKYFD